MPAKKASAKVRRFGRYIVQDPNICHGAMTFRGTRIFVADVLEQVAEGTSWDDIIREWRGSISTYAIAEAISIAQNALMAPEESACRNPS
jgi:uncharacterized protein (DUF433 family)